MASAEALAAYTEQYRAVQIAHDLGLLSYVSILLAIVAIMLAAGGVFAFFNFRMLASKQATEEARKVAETVAERAAIQRLESELPKMFAEYSELVKNSVGATAANEIAQAQSEEG